MEFKKLGDIVVNHDGKRIPLKSSERKKMEHRIYPYYGASGVIDQVDDYLFDGKYLLVSEDGANLLARSYAIAFIASGKFWVNNHAHVLQAIPEYTTNEYLELFLNKISLKPYVTGSAQPKLNQKNLNGIKIPLPPLPQQKKIAAILDAADAYRQKTKALIAKYEELTQSLFLDIFGDPVANTKGWKVNNLGELATHVLSGNTPKGGSKVYVEEGITFFRSQNVWKNRIELDDVAFIDEATHANMKKSSLKHKDILMTKTGRINTENSSLGRAAMYLGEDYMANVNGHVYLIRLKKGIINEFILFILTTIQYRDHIRRVCVGGIDKRQLNKNHIEEFPIISPPLELQKKFSANLKIIQTQKEKLQASLAKSEDLFNSLLQKAFKGELS